MILHESVTHGSAIKGFERFKTYCLYDAWLEREIEYDYSKVVYNGREVKVGIGCPKHGPFWQIPNAHLHQNSGCPKCGTEAQSNVLVDTVEQFIAKAKEVHGDKYIYSKVVYKNAMSKVPIICPEHGDFWQVPNNHLNGSGCPECGYEAAGKAVAKANTQTTEQFRALAKKVHGDKYDYSRADERDGEGRRCIICREHGPFWQAPNNHSRGRGCRECAVGGFKPQLPAQLYLYNIEDRWLGFGITGVPKNRHATHRYTLRNVEHELMYTFEFDEGANALEIESLLKQKFVMVDIGYDGFRTEAMGIDNLDSVLNIIEEHEEL